MLPEVGSTAPSSVACLFIPPSRLEAPWGTTWCPLCLCGLWLPTVCFPPKNKYIEWSELTENKNTGQSLECRISILYACGCPLKYWIIPVYSSIHPYIQWFIWTSIREKIPHKILIPFLGGWFNWRRRGPFFSAEHLGGLENKQCIQSSLGVRVEKMELICIIKLDKFGVPGAIQKGLWKAEKHSRRLESEM